MLYPVQRNEHGPDYLYDEMWAYAQALAVHDPVAAAPYVA